MVLVGATFSPSNQAIEGVATPTVTRAPLPILRGATIVRTTQIEKLERLSAHLGGKVELYAKREDCNSGLAFAG